MNDTTTSIQQRPAAGGDNPPARAASAALAAVRRSWPAWGAAILVLLAPMTAPAKPRVPFQSVYQGTFTIAFGFEGTNDLRFAGDGIASHLGLSTVDGNSTLSATDPLCSVILDDAVTLTAANGDELCLTNSGQDCLDLSALPHVFIRGSGTFKVRGGTGRFQGARGRGTFAVVAEILVQDSGVAAGTFELRFEGWISPPGGSPAEPSPK